MALSQLEDIFTANETTLRSSAGGSALRRAAGRLRPKNTARSPKGSPFAWGHHPPPKATIPAGRRHRFQGTLPSRWLQPAWAAQGRQSIGERLQGAAALTPVAEAVVPQIGRIAPRRQSQNNALLPRRRVCVTKTVLPLPLPKPPPKLDQPLSTTPARHKANNKRQIRRDSQSTF